MYSRSRSTSFAYPKNAEADASQRRHSYPNTFSNALKTIRKTLGLQKDPCDPKELEKKDSIENRVTNLSIPPEYTPFVEFDMEKNAEELKAIYKQYLIDAQKEREPSDASNWLRDAHNTFIQEKLPELKRELLAQLGIEEYAHNSEDIRSMTLTVTCQFKRALDLKQSLLSPQQNRDLAHNVNQEIRGIYDAIYGIFDKNNALLKAHLDKATRDPFWEQVIRRYKTLRETRDPITIIDTLVSVLIFKQRYAKAIPSSKITLGIGISLSKLRLYAKYLFCEKLWQECNELHNKNQNAFLNSLVEDTLRELKEQANNSTIIEGRINKISPPNYKELLNAPRNWARCSSSCRTSEGAKLAKKLEVLSVIENQTDIMIEEYVEKLNKALEKHEISFNKLDTIAKKIPVLLADENVEYNEYLLCAKLLLSIEIAKNENKKIHSLSHIDRINAQLNIMARGLQTHEKLDKFHQQLFHRDLTTEKLLSLAFAPENHPTLFATPKSSDEIGEKLYKEFMDQGLLTSITQQPLLRDVTLIHLK